MNFLLFLHSLIHVFQHFMSLIRKGVVIGLGSGKYIVSHVGTGDIILPCN